MTLPAFRAHWPSEWIDAFEERAAILEFDAGLDRDEAECQAEEMVREEEAANRGELRFE